MEASTSKLDPQQVLTLSGRRFRSAPNTTFEQDVYIMDLVHDAGLQKLAEQYRDTDQNIDNITHDVVLTAFRSGKLFLLLGAVLVEEGKDWTPDSAKTNAQFFASLINGEDKEQLKGSIVAVILGFFVSGLLVLTTSKTSSVKLEVIEQEKENSPKTEESIASGTGA